MDFDPFWLILFFFFFVMPLIERVLKGGKKPPPRRPPQRRRLPGERDRYEAGQGRAPEARLPRQERTSEPSSAADMIPPELWEILTGERRPPTSGPADTAETGVGTTEPKRREPSWWPEPSTPESKRPAPSWRSDPSTSEPKRPAPSWRPEPSTPEPIESGETRIRDEEATAAELARRRRADVERDRAVRHTPPVVVSLETEPLAEPLRHTAFHRTLNALPPPAGRRRSEPPITASRLRGKAQLRRAVLMQEILGTPKGLDPD